MLKLDKNNRYGHRARKLLLTDHIDATNSNAADDGHGDTYVDDDGVIDDHDGHADYHYDDGDDDHDGDDDDDKD